MQQRAHLRPLERIFANMHVLVAYLDRHFNFIHVNQAYAIADGRPPEEFEGKNHFDLYPNAENERIFRQVLDSGAPYVAYGRSFEHPGHPERGITYWDWTLHPLLDEHGQVESLLLTIVDATARERAQHERAAADVRFRLLFESAGDAIFIHDLKGKFLEVNSVACIRLGYSRDELLRMRVSDIDAPEMAARLFETLPRLRTEGHVVVDSIHLSRSGQAIPVEINAKLFEYDNRPAVLSIVRDLSWRKQAEMALEQSRRDNQALLDAAPETALLLSPNGEVIALNQTAAERFGLSPERLIHQNIYSFMSPATADYRRTIAAQVIHSGQPAGFEDERAGMRFRTVMHPVLDSDRNVNAIAVYATDITEQYRNQQLEQLVRTIDQGILAGRPIEELLTHICAELTALFGLKLAWVGQREENGAVTVITHAGPATAYLEEQTRIGVRWDDSPRGNGPIGRAIRKRILQNLDIDAESFSPWRDAARRHGLKTVLSLPLLQQDTVYGALTLYAERSDAFNPAIFKRLQEIVFPLQVSLSTALDQQKLRILGTALAAAGNGVIITERDGRIQWVNQAFVELCGYSAAELIGSSPRLLKSGLQTGDYYRALWATILEGKRWCAETVERQKDGTLYTVRQTITPVIDDSGAITHFIAIHDDITALKETEARIRHLAHFDILTGLPNRALFYDRLSQTIVQAKRANGGFCLMFLDLDHFKIINDTFGHASGDELLKQVAIRLRNCIRESDTAARLGGDEFTIILRNVTDTTAIAHIADKINHMLAAPFVLADAEITTGTSIGIALYPADGTTADELVQAADSAMYLAKNSTRGSYRFLGAQP